MRLPLPKDLSCLEPPQQHYAAELTDILHNADNNVLLPNWESRTALMTDLMSRYSSDFGIAVGKAACEVNGFDDEALPRAVKSYTSSHLYLALSFTDCFSVFGDREQLHWSNAISKRSGIEFAVQSCNPFFVRELSMLAAEYETRTLGQYLIELAQGTHRPEVDIFIGEASDIKNKVNWDPEESLGQVERNIMRYNRLARKNRRPIDPERLVGTVASAMRMVNTL